MNAENAPEGRLVTPNTWASLVTHVVTSLGSHGARVGGEVGVLTLYLSNRGPCFGRTQNEDKGM